MMDESHHFRLGSWSEFEARKIVYDWPEELGHWFMVHPFLMLGCG